VTLNILIADMLSVVLVSYGSHQPRNLGKVI